MRNQVLDHGQTLGMFSRRSSFEREGIGRGERLALQGLVFEVGYPILPMAITGSDQFLQIFFRTGRA